MQRRSVIKKGVVTGSMLAGVPAAVGGTTADDVDVSKDEITIERKPTEEVIKFEDITDEYSYAIYHDTVHLIRYRDKNGAIGIRELGHKNRVSIAELEEPLSDTGEIKRRKVSEYSIKNTEVPDVITDSEDIGRIYRDDSICSACDGDRRHRATGFTFELNKYVDAVGKSVMGAGIVALAKKYLASRIADLLKGKAVDITVGTLFNLVNSNEYTIMTFEHDQSYLIGEQELLSPSVGEGWDNEFSDQTTIPYAWPKHFLLNDC